MKAFEVELRLRNNLLKQRREELGMSQRALSKAAGVSASQYCGLETMSRNPLRVDGTWKEIVEKVAAFHGLAPEELFPPAVLAVENSVISRKLEAEEAFALASVNVPLDQERLESVDRDREVLRLARGALTDREMEIVKRRFGLEGCEPETLLQLGERLGICRERVRGLEARALSKLKHPRVGRELKALR